MGTEDAILIGVDSGGSKTIGCAISLNGQIVGMGYGGPTNTTFISEDDAAYAMREAVAGSLGISLSEPVPQPQVRSIYMSAPGFTADAANRALSDLCPEGQIKVEADPPAVFRAAIPAGDGIVVLSGTGSFAAGLWKGKWLTNGGWGPLLGDEGSGYWIGLEALKAVALVADKRAPATLLQTILRRTLFYSFDEELRRFAYKQSLNRQRIAGLTILVAQAAREGDEVAYSILVRAGEKLAELVENLAVRLETNGQEVPVSLVGGVARESLVVASFRAAVERNVHGAKYVPPRFEPWGGAVLLACEMAKIDVTPNLVKNIESVAAQFDRT